MDIIKIGLLFVLAFLLQGALTFLQIKNFNVSYRRLRQMGRVVIGTKKGSYRAGAISMMAIDENNKVLATEFMQGTTVLARFKKMDILNGYNLEEITEELCDEKKFSKSLKLAVLEGVKNFEKVKNGEEIEMPKSPLGKLADKVRGK